MLGRPTVTYLIARRFGSPNFYPDADVHPIPQASSVRVEKKTKKEIST